MKKSFAGCFLLALPTTYAKCFEPSPAFPVPQWKHGLKELNSAFQVMEQELKAIVSDVKFNTSSFSLAITSSSETLYSQFHTAEVLNETRPGDEHVNGDSLYRIASITKTFTVLGLLHLQKAGKLNLDDPILKHIPELGGKLPWKDITLRILASQLSGLPRDWAQSDLISELDDPTKFGLPPTTTDRLPKCDQYGNNRPCTRKEFLHQLKIRKPLFAPNQKSTYSNIAFELLGLVIEDTTGLSYSDYVQQEIFDTIDMSSSTLQRPTSDEHAVLPAIGFNYWDVDEGVQSPTGGIYSSASDMSKYVRYILTHFNTLATGVNWFMPASWSTGMNSFYGMPFEIFRTDRILEESRRPVTFVTKSGGLPGYYSLIILMEEYGLGFTMLVGGKADLLSVIREVVTKHVVQAAEAVIWTGVEQKYAGTYVATDKSLNSSLALKSSPSSGLMLESFISNGTDIFQTLLPEFAGADGDWYAQLVPTFLYKNETAQEGEIWRITVVRERPEKEKGAKIWDDFCITDLDLGIYAGLPITEVVFWHEQGLVELPAWKATFSRADETDQSQDWRPDL